MKYKIRVGNQVFTVEINDLHNQPVVALVDGEPIEVWLDEEGKPSAPSKKAATPSPGRSISSEPQVKTTRSETSQSSSLKGSQVRSPIPGVIVAINVHEGDLVESGQELVILEAMKMKNTIRSPRAGTISKINIVPGQSVQHHETLIEFDD